MKILGNRILVSRIEEEKKEGFQTIEIQDSFVNKGMVALCGTEDRSIAGIGDIVLFAKYSPDTQEVKHEGKDMKIINVDDILAIL